MRKLGHSGQENKTKITVSALQDTVERFQYFPILIQQVLIQDRLKQWLVILINQHNNLLSCLHACLLYHVSKTLFRTTVFLLLTIEQLPFLQILIKHSRQVSSSFIFPGIQIQVQNRIFFPFLFQLFDGQTLKQILASLKVGFKGRKKQTLAKTTGTAQEIRFTYICNLINHSRLIYIEITIPTYFLKSLYAYRQLTHLFHVIIT